MFGKIEEHNTRETYLGHNMEDAINNYEKGRWPVGFEQLQGILSRQGNTITVDDMLYLLEHHPSIYNQVRRKCFAVRTCQPDPSAPGGGCSRNDRPGCQSFVSNLQNHYQPYFRRGSGSLGACNACPINSDAGLERLKSESTFRGRTMELGIHKHKRITTTDTLHVLSRAQPGLPAAISLSERGHRLEFDVPSDLTRQHVLEFIAELAVNGEDVCLDVIEDELVVYDQPLLGISSDTWDVEWPGFGDEEDWSINLVTFSDSRMRYFVGSIDPSQAIHRFVERIPRGSAHDQRIRLKLEDSLLVWLPSPTGEEQFLPTWEERLGLDTVQRAQNLKNTIPPQFISFELFKDYPGVFMFVKNSKHILLGNDVRKFLHMHGRSLDGRTLAPQFEQDLDSIRFFWGADANPHATVDTGGKPQFVLDQENVLTLLVQISKNSVSTSDGAGSNTENAFPPIEVIVLYSDGTPDVIGARLIPNAYGFAWASFKFNQEDRYHLRFRNTSDQRIRFVEINNLNDEAGAENQCEYYGDSGEWQPLVSSENWGKPPHSSLEPILISCKDMLFQGIEGLDDAMVSESSQRMELGHLAEIARLIFHHHSIPFEGHQTTRLGVFERRFRAIIYNVIALGDLEVESEHNLMRVLTALGEFEYWERGEGYENRHMLKPKKTMFGVVQSLESWVQIIDARPTKVLKEGKYPSIWVDMESGLRFVRTEDTIGHAEPAFMVHSNEAMIAPTPDAFLYGLWDAVEASAGPMPEVDGWTERRWDSTAITRNGSRNKLPANRTAVSNIAENLYQYGELAGWLKKNKWHQVTSIQLEQNRRLFISLRYPRDWSLTEVPWEIWLGCLDTNSMSESFVQLANRQGDENQSWIDELGNIGSERSLYLPWLSNPKNGLYDAAYLTREVARSFATIAHRDLAQADLPVQHALSNRGIPGWIFQKHVNDLNLIDTRSSAIQRLCEAHDDLDQPEEMVLGNMISGQVLLKFGW